MFCSNCGKEIEDDASFCRFCGKKLREAGPADSKGTEPATNNRYDIASDTVVSKKKNNSGLVIAIAAVAVLLIAVGIVIFVKSSSPARKYEEQLKLAQHYLYEQDYDKAIAAYRVAIEIDPKSEAAYLGMAESYAEKGELQAAIDILKEGLEKTESVAMEERLAELERQFADQKARELVNWQGGEWTNRDDILPHKNEEGYIVFGAYEQDGDESNGPEPIEWEILEENGKGTFLVSRYVLDAQSYNREKAQVTWESCTLRSWLNDEFLNKAFTSGEQARIRSTEVVNLDNPKNGYIGGNSTRDRVFLLSVDEVISHYNFNSWYDEPQAGYSQELMISPTAYAKQQGENYVEIGEEDYNGSADKGWRGLISDNYSRDCIGLECAEWWLRSPTGNSYTACVVGFYGSVSWGNVHFYINDSSVGLRPALYIDQ